MPARPRHTRQSTATGIAARDTARTVSRENVEIVRGLYRAFARGDWAAAGAPLHPSIEMDTTRVPMPELAGIWRGTEEVASFWRQWLDAWGEQDFEEPELIEAGANVLSWVASHRLRGKGSGADVTMPPYGWVMTLRDGKLVKSTFYLDRGEALEAAGRRE